MKTILHTRALWIAFLVLALGASTLRSQTQSPATAPAVQQPRRDAHVVMISIDGLVPEYYTASAAVGLKVPTLTKMKLEGAYADGVEGVYPSVTYPAHTSLITGVRPALHGIVQNRIFEAPTEAQTLEWYWYSKDLTAETLWMLAKKNGLTTGAVGWPVTAGAEIDYNVPEIFDPKENPRTSKRTIQYSTPGLLAKIAAATTSHDNSVDGRRLAASEFIIKEYKPNLMLIHLIELDGAHHRFGTRTPQALEITERLDGYVGRIIEATKAAGIFEKTTFFLVSDHGFAKVEKRFYPNVVLAKERLITLDATGAATDWKAAAWPAGGACAIVLRDPNDKETAKRVSEIFQPYLTGKGRPLYRILTKNEMQRLGGIPQAELMLDATIGFTFDEKLTGDEIAEAKDYRGTHGHLPTRAELRASLIVYGAGARTGAKMAVARMIDIAPTIAGLLGLRLANAEGAALRGVIKPGLLFEAPPAKKSKPAGN